MELVEQANGVIKTKLRCQLADHEGQGWSDTLPNITLGMNRQPHSAMKHKMSYKSFFNWQPWQEDRDVVAPNVQVDQIEDMLFDGS